MLSVLAPTVRSHGSRRTLIVRIVCVVIAVASFGGIVFGGSLTAKAASAADSSVTVSWAGDTSSAASVQPARDTGGFEYNEFKNIKVRVEQTQNLIDQAVRVDVSGFSGGTQAATDGTGQLWSTATNFMQAMQCWGDPSKPEFRQTCEWGGRFAANNGLGFSVYGDNVYRIASRDVSPTATNAVDNPFVARDGESFSARQDIDSSGNKEYPIFREFGADSSNELQGARIKDDGTGSFDFEMQSSIQAPHLGCGSSSSTLNCYLVLVPRGTVYGGHDAACSAIYGAGGTAYSYGLSPAIQAGSPLNPGCDYWNNRIVVPLKFNQVAGVCPGGAEENVIGSQLLISAMASWQPTLCNSVGSPISFNTNPDSVARAELLEKKANVAFTSYPITRDELQDDDQTAFDHTSVSYAPVAIGAATVSFLADGRNGQVDKLTLSPRLLAKLLTQSYIFEVPNDGTDPGNDDYAQLGKVNQSYNYLFQDPDFQAANTNWGDFINNPSIVLPGPSEADAIAQIWKWIQSDSDARDFLNGKPDPWGMIVNPNYLPAGNSAAQVPVYDPTTGAKLPTLKPVGFSNLDGSPMSLATAPISYFPKEDISEVPHKLGVETSRYNSIQASPYVDDFVKAAVITFRANPGAKTGWDPTAIKPGSDSRGDWVSGGPQVPGQRFVIAITDAAATARYDLDPVGLRAANGTAVTIPTPDAMAAAISSGLVATTNPAVKQVDPAHVSAGGYPLTTVVYAAVNLSGSTTASRTSIAKMLTYVVGDGQTAGTQVGQLPAGYLPLSGDLQAQAKSAATAIAMYTGASNSPDDGTNIGGSNNNGSGDSGGDSGSGPTGSSSSGPRIASLGASKVALTPAGSSTPFGQIFLGLALALGIIGAIFAPLVFRGWGRG